MYRQFGDWTLVRTVLRANDFSLLHPTHRPARRQDSAGETYARFYGAIVQAYENECTPVPLKMLSAVRATLTPPRLSAETSVAVFYSSRQSLTQNRYLRTGLPCDGMLNVSCCGSS